MAMDRYRSGGYMPLRQALDQLFADSFITPSALGGGSGGFPPADLHTTDNDVILKMAVPGANPSDINVSVTGDTVSVSGEVKHEHGSGQGEGQQKQSQQSQTQKTQTQQSQGQSGQSEPYFQEIWQGRFQRTFTLPTEVDSNKATADFSNGILTITMPKSEATKPRKITVQAGQGANQTSGQTGSTQKETVPVQSGSSSR
ncbi:MAG: Hsp20/alpha crystallin family protein [Chloroflexota bacterium]